MRTIKVQGKGRISSRPDLITLSFKIEAKDRDYEKCIRQLNRQVDELRENIIAAGQDKEDLKTSGFNIRADTKYANGRRTFDTYAASHNLQIVLSVDKDLLNKVLANIAQGHSGAEIRLSFSVKDKDALRQKAIAQAVKNAQENAQTLADAAGVSLGQLVQMDYGWAEVRIYDTQMSMLNERKAQSADLAVDIEPVDVSAEDNVTLIYEIL